MALDQVPSSITGSSTPLKFADSPRIRAPREVVIQRVARALNDLNDRELRDIGISRYEIGDIARGLARRG